jgi:predicted AAA+ superfamily ATPase
LIPEAFERRHPGRGPVHYLFDEIQNVPGWESFVRRLLDERASRLILTGSSSRLLSREIATSLRGRSLSSELLPFSFAESLRHAGVEPPQRFPPSSRDRARLERALLSYLDAGGFPEVQELDGQLRSRILRDYVDVALFRDVVERQQISNIPALRYVLRSLLANSARPFSIHRIHNDLKSQGIAVSKDTVHAFLAHLEDAFLLFAVFVDDESLRVRQVNPRKAYAIDPGVARLFARDDRDLGFRLETAVYLELRRRGFEVSYGRYEGGHEVDFVARRSNEVRLIQVCASMRDAATRERELQALNPALKRHRKAEAVVVTLHEQGEEKAGRHRVPLIPAWRFLLDEQGMTA